MSVQVMQFHKALCSEGSLIYVFMLCGHHFEMLNNFIFEFVFQVKSYRSVGLMPGAQSLCSHSGLPPTNSLPSWARFSASLPTST